MGLFGPPNIDKMLDKNDVRGLIKALRYKKDKSVRERAAYALGEIGDSRALEPLISALKDQDSYVHQEAANALGMFGDPRAVEPLIISLQHEDELVRQEAALALGQIGAPHAVKPLIAAVKDEDLYLRKNAAQALGEIGDPRAVEALITLLRDKDRDVRQSAAETLGKIGDPRAVEPLITALGDDSSNVRKAAAEALKALGWRPDKSADGATYWVMMGMWNRCVQIGPLAVEPLIYVLMDKDDVDMGVRLAVAKALGKIGDPSSVEPLIATLWNKDVGIRLAAAQALGMIGDPRAIIPLIDALRDKNDQVQKAAAQALSKSCNSQVVEQLITALKDKDVFVRTSAVKALCQIGKPAIKPLIAALGDEIWYVREAAVEALDELRWRPDEDAHEAAYWVVKQKWDRCVQIGALAVEPLIFSLQHENWLVRKAAVQTLGEIGEPRTVDPLCTAVQDKNIRVREAAVEALETLGWQPDEGVNGAAYWIAKREWCRCVQIGAPVLDPLIIALGFWPWEVRQAAAEALDKLEWQPDEGHDGAAYWIAKRDWDRCIQIGAPAVEALIEVLRYDISAIQTLGRIGNPRAVDPLITLLKDNDKSIRISAAWWLVKLYKSSKLSFKYRNLILSQRHTITTSHVDKMTKHYRGYGSSDCHEDHGTHEDNKGIGVAFPV